jgi:hypothetical protein
MSTQTQSDQTQKEENGIPVQAYCCGPHGYLTRAIYLTLRLPGHAYFPGDADAPEVRLAESIQPAFPTGWAEEVNEWNKLVRAARRGEAKPYFA